MEYDAGFEADGNITALNIRGFFLTGAELDLGDNDPQVMAAGVDQVGDLPWCGGLGQACRNMLSPVKEQGGWLVAQAIHTCE